MSSGDVLSFNTRKTEWTDLPNFKILIAINFHFSANRSEIL